MRGAITSLLCVGLFLMVTGEEDVVEFTRSLVQTRAGPEIYSLHVQTDIAYRFATTQVISRLANRGDEAKEAVFAMTIPKTAFITSFILTMGGEEYSGIVKEKVQAKKEYEAAKQRGESAGRVSAVESRNTFQFRVAINVGAESKVDFNLTYQELLERKFGFYEYVLNINPGQIVRDIRVDVYIRESRQITEVRVPPIKHNSTHVVDMTQINKDVTIMRDGPGEYHILYDPEPSEKGISGQLIVQYDVSRESNAGEIQVIDGYFVHYFAPSGLQPVKKNVLFVIDVSGSMTGDKIRQTKDAMFTILDDLREGDSFNIITFSSVAEAWSESMRDVSVESITQAKKYVWDIDADGGTNINDAILRGIAFLETVTAKEWEKKPSMIIFLTDGDPTSGITTTSRILSNIRHANRGRYTIFSLGFGQNLDFPFLQKISLQNNGIARRIYADTDSTLQLEGFYNEVSTPVLSDVEITYVGDIIEEGTVTDLKFPAYYRGGELIVAGKLKDGVKNLDSRVQGYASGGYMQFDTNIRISKVEKEALQTAYSNFTEKLWAFLTIRKLLDKMLQASDATEKEAAKAKALELSLKYSFVTPLTSMVVIKPDNPHRNIGDILDPDEEAADGTVRRGSGSPGPPASQPTRRRRPSFVDNDPHFIVHVDGITDGICFNMDGPPGLIYQLIHDRITGLVVNGLVVGKKIIPKGHKYPRTYIGELMVIFGGASIKITPSEISYNNSKTHMVLKWKDTVEYKDGDINIFIEARTKVFVRLGDGIVLGVLRHIVKPKHKTKVNFLGLYIVDDRSFSNYSQGLIGQFMHNTASLHNNRTAGSHQIAELHVHGPHTPHKRVDAKRIRRRDMDRRDYVNCWNVKNNGHGLLTGKHIDYVVPNMLYWRPSLLHYKLARQLFSHDVKSPNSSRRKVIER